MLLRLDWCDPGEKTKAILLMLEKSSSNFVGVRKKSHILVIFPFLAPGVFDPYMAPLVHTWSTFFCSHDTNWEAEFQREDSGGLWSFERLVPESFCFWFDHSSRHDYRMFLWRERLFPTSFFCPLNLIASFQEKSMFLPFTLFIVDVELDLCSLGGTGPG